MTALAVTTVVVVGLMVGVETAVAVFLNPIFDRLPGDGGLAARSDGARVLGRVMPFWYIASLVLAVLWAALYDGEARAGVLIAAGLLLLSAVMSVLLLVPINSRAARWSKEGTPADWRAQLHRWDLLHYGRLVVIVGAFVLLAAAGTTS